MKNLDQIPAGYSYVLPPEAIRQTPLAERESSNLLVFQPGSKPKRLHFRDIVDELPTGSVLVLNDTRVVPARLAVHKPTGGKAELLITSRTGKSIYCLSNRLLEVGSVVSTEGGKERFTVRSHVDATYELTPNFPSSKLTELLDRAGQTPLPPYLKRSPLTETERRQRYQSVFAKKGESAAAPTASLHFTEALLKKLTAAGIKIVRIRLDVSLGTFAPLTEQQLASNRLHAETYTVSTAAARTLNDALKKKKLIIPVGTTALRALESAATGKKVRSGSSTTQIFIRPGYEFKVCSGLITNFHVPESSLMMLVASFVGRKKLLELYQQALSWGFSFLSFGDAMLVLPKTAVVGEKSKKQRKPAKFTKKTAKNISLK